MANGASPLFNVVLRFLTSPTPVQQAAFDSAKARWQRLIYGDVPNAFAMFPAGFCGPGTPAINEVIDDIIIYVQLDAIDGRGGILGQAGPCLFRNGGTPGAGLMHFDTADVADLIAAGQFDDVILHEMGHVLGFGTIWTDVGLLIDPVSQGGTDPHFVGPQALAAFDSNGGAFYSAGAKVPVENCVGIPGCGAGNYDGHWRESVFANELMTGFIDPGANPAERHYDGVHGRGVTAFQWSTSMRRATARTPRCHRGAVARAGACASGRAPRS